MQGVGGDIKRIDLVAALVIGAAGVLLVDYVTAPKQKSLISRIGGFLRRKTKAGDPKKWDPVQGPVLAQAKLKKLGLADQKKQIFLCIGKEELNKGCCAREEAEKSWTFLKVIP